MQSCSVHHCVLLLLTLTFTTAPVAAAVLPIQAKLHQRVTLPCAHNCSGEAKWTFKSNRSVVARCDQTSCSSVVKGYEMSHDQYLKEDLSLTITAAEYSMRDTYACECLKLDYAVWRLSIETVFSAVQVKHDGDLILDLTVPEPVEVIYTSSDSADGERICNGTQHSLQCNAEYTHRTSLRYPELTLRDVTYSDSGLYTIRDTENKEDIRVYSVSVTGLTKGVTAGIVVLVLVLVLGIIGVIIYKRRAAEEERRAAEEKCTAAKEERRAAEEKCRAAEETWRAAEEKWRAAEEERRAAVEKRRAAVEKCRAAEEKCRAAVEKWRAAEEERRAAEEERRAAEEERRAAEEERRAAEEERRAAEEKCRAAEEKCRAAEEELRAAEEKWRAAVEERRAAEEKCRAAEEKCRAAEEKLRAAKKALRPVVNERRKVENEERAVAGQMNQLFNLLQYENLRRKDQINPRTRQMESIEKNPEELRSEMEELKRKFDEVEKEINDLEDGYRENRRYKDHVELFCSRRRGDLDMYRNLCKTIQTESPESDPGPVYRLTDSLQLMNMMTAMERVFDNLERLRYSESLELQFSRYTLVDSGLNRIKYWCEKTRDDLKRFKEERGDEANVKLMIDTEALLRALGKWCEDKKEERQKYKHKPVSAERSENQPPESEPLNQSQNQSQNH